MGWPDVMKSAGSVAAGPIMEAKACLIVLRGTGPRQRPTAGAVIESVRALSRVMHGGAFPQRDPGVRVIARVIDRIEDALFQRCSARDDALSVGAPPSAVVMSVDLRRVAVCDRKDRSRRGTARHGTAPTRGRTPREARHTLAVPWENGCRCDGGGRANGSWRDNGWR